MKFEIRLGEPLLGPARTPTFGLRRFVPEYAHVDVVELRQGTEPFRSRYFEPLLPVLDALETRSDPAGYLLLSKTEKLAVHLEVFGNPYLEFTQLVSAEISRRASRVSCLLWISQFNTPMNYES